MQVPRFTVLAHNCWCQSCFMSSYEDLGYQAGVVCGHSNTVGEWSCVYCGQPVFRHTPWYASLWQSVASWVGWVAWEIKVQLMLRLNSSKG